MNRKQWMLLNNGLSPAKIWDKKLVKVAHRGLVPIVEALMDIKEEGYIVVPHNQMIFPRWDEFSREMYGKEFKKRGPQFNLKTKTGPERIEEKISPQELILKEMEKIYTQEKDIEEITRRGIKWDMATASTMHTLMPQRDLMAGWRLASLCILFDIDLKYSSPGDIFLTELPKRDADPTDRSKRYAAKVYNFATKLPDGYADWPNLDGQVSLIEGDFEKAMKGVDMYSSASLRYRIQELRFNFQLVAAAILRNHYTDKRFAQGKFKNRKRVKNQPIEPVLLNVTMPPKRKFMEFDNKLQNNILIEQKGNYADGKPKRKRLRKLNAGEREPFYCVYGQLVGVRNCYRHDEALHSLDQAVADQKEVLGIKL